MSTEPLRAALAEALPERPFDVRFWDGAELPSTNGAGGPTFTVRSPLALSHMLRAPGQLGLGRAYVAGAVDVDDIDATLGAARHLHARRPSAPRAKARLAAAAVRAGGLGRASRASPRPSCARAAAATAWSATAARCATTTTSPTSSSRSSSASR